MERLEDGKTEGMALVNGEPGWIVLGLVTVLARWLVATYNRLVVLRQRCRRAFFRHRRTTQARHDLVPNVVERLEGYRGTNAGTLAAVIAGAQATT
jgi:LemA protein